MSSTSATWRPTASAARPATCRSKPSDRPGLDRRPASTAWSAWSSATRTTPASSCGRWATRPAFGANHERWPPGPATDPTRPIHYEGDYDAERRRRLQPACTPTHRRIQRISAGDRRPQLRNQPLPPESFASSRSSLRIRPRDGQRPRRPEGILGSRSTRNDRAHGRLRLGMDRSRHPPQDRRRRGILRLRRRLRRPAQRRQLRQRRPGLPRPHALARPARVQDDHRAGRDHDRPGRPEHLHQEPAGLRAYRFGWTVRTAGYRSRPAIWRCRTCRRDTSPPQASRRPWSTPRCQPRTTSAG